LIRVESVVEPLTAVSTRGTVASRRAKHDIRFGEGSQDSKEGESNKRMKIEQNPPVKGAEALLVRYRDNESTMDNNSGDGGERP
jgi:hypothetical protein